MQVAAVLKCICCGKVWKPYLAEQLGDIAYEITKVIPICLVFVEEGNEILHRLE